MLVFVFSQHKDEYFNFFLLLALIAIELLSSCISSGGDVRKLRHVHSAVCPAQLLNLSFFHCMKRDVIHEQLHSWKIIFNCNMWNRFACNSHEHKGSSSKFSRFECEERISLCTEKCFLLIETEKFLPVWVSSGVLFRRNSLGVDVWDSFVNNLQWKWDEDLTLTDRPLFKRVPTVRSSITWNDVRIWVKPFAESSSLSHFKLRHRPPGRTSRKVSLWVSLKIFFLPRALKIAKKQQRFN